MANSFSNLTYTILAQQALESFTATLTPLMAFANNFSAEAVQRGDKVKVAFVNSASAAIDFAGTYQVQDASATGVDITINKRKFVSWGLTTEELATQPQLNLERFARQKGFALAKAVLQDIWSTVTAANYGNTAYSQGSGGDKVTVTAANFGADDVGSLLECCEKAYWPQNERALILDPAYYANLFQQPLVVGYRGVGNNSAIEGANTITNLLGFNVYSSALIPSNSENLVGFAANPDAIAVAMRSLIPEQGIANRPMVQPITDPQSGMTIVLREWMDPTYDTVVRTLECNYGYVKGNATAIKRITSA